MTAELRIRVRDNNDKTADVVIHLLSCIIAAALRDEVAALVAEISNGAVDGAKIKETLSLAVGSAVSTYVPCVALYAGSVGSGTLWRYWYGVLGSQYAVRPITYREDLDETVRDALDLLGAISWPDEAQLVQAICCEEANVGG